MSIIQKTPIRILIVDDDEDDFLITRDYINNIEAQHFTIDWCYTYSEAQEKICEAKHDLYFVDYFLGAKTGLELIQGSIKNNCEQPFILLTGNGSHAIDLMALESGAVDYLVKGELSVEKMERCIRYSMDRAAALKALRANERKFRNIFERSKEMVFIADEELFFTEVNSASFELLEFDRDALIAKSLYELLANKNDAADVKKQLSASGDVADKEVEILTRSGEKKQCVLTLSTEKDITGTSYIQGIIHDISFLKRQEKDTLRLEKLNVANRLVRIMAHEVRNPLSNIMLSAEQLQAFNNPGSAMCLGIINRNAKRIGDLITDLLNSSGRDPISVEKKSLQAIMDETLENAMDRMKLRHIQLQRDYVTEQAWVMADNEKLKIAFLNIIINAVEAMPQNEGKLLVAIKNKHPQYIVSIEDNGCGINEEDLAQVFDPYFTSKQNGMGLGLASTLNILQSHGASYNVQSSPGKGTVFHLFFNMA